MWEFGHFIILYTLCCAIINHGSYASNSPLFTSFKFNLLPADTVVVSGSPAQLQCSAAYDGTEATVYTWERNGEPLPVWPERNQNRVKYNNGSLAFSSVSNSGLAGDSTTGLYRCIAAVPSSSGYHRITTPKAHLQTAYMGDFIHAVPAADTVLETGDNFMLECHIDSLPAAEYTWTKDERPILGDNRILIHGAGEVLEILSASTRDSGHYVCVASNIVGSKSTGPITLTITSNHHPTSTRKVGSAVVPVFSVKPRDVSPPQHTDVTLYCSLHGRGSNGDKPRLTWLRQGSTVDVISGEGHYSTVGFGSLLIRNVTQADSGTYTCRGENSDEFADAQASLTVTVPPYIVTGPVNTYSHVNEDLELNCDIRGTPTPTVTWYKDSEVMVNRPYFKISAGRLKVMGLMISDSGYFQCVGENIAGKISSTAQVIVLDEDMQMAARGLSSVPPSNHTALPNKPSNLRTTHVSSTRIALVWQSPQSPVTGYTVSTTALSHTGRVRNANVTAAEYELQNLQPDTEYIIQVSAYNNNRHSVVPAEIQVRTSADPDLPSAVNNLSVQAASHQGIRVTWSPPTQLSGYILEYRVYYYSDDPSVETYKSVSGGSSTTVVVDDLLPYTLYHVRMVAYNDNGPGTSTDQLTVRTYSSTPSSPPQDVAAQVTSASSILLTWSPPPPDALNGQLTGYKIRCKAELSFGRAQVYTTDATAISYEILELESGTDYMLKVGAINVNGTGVLSGWVKAKTSSTQLDESRVPGRPRSLTALPLSREIIVTWVPANDGVLVRGYKLGYGTISPEEQWKTITHFDPPITELTGLMPANVYVLRLIPYNDVGEGVPIEQQTFTAADTGSDTKATLFPPLAVSPEVISSTAVILRWYDSSLGDEQINTDNRLYTVQYIALSGPQRGVERHRNTTSLRLDVTGLKPYTSYEFSVMVSKDTRSSIYSLSAENTTLEDLPGTAPVDLTVMLSALRDSYLDISWRPPSEPNGRIESYILYSSNNPGSPLHLWSQDPISGDFLSYEFGPVNPGTVYYFKIMAVNVMGNSPVSDIVQLETPGSVVATKGSKPTSQSEAGSDNVLGGDVGSREGVLTGDGSVDVDSDPNSLFGLPYMLWIVVGSVAFLALITITVLTVILCRRRRRKQNNKPASSPRLNSTSRNSPCQPVGSRGRPPDLWADHADAVSSRRGMGTSSSVKSESEDPDEMTSMLQSNFDVSVSMAGDYDARYSSVGRGRPVIIAPQASREGMPRAAVPPMTSDPARPLYPKTQFASGGQYDSTPRVHVGDTSQPSSEYYHHHQSPQSHPFEAGFGCHRPSSSASGVCTPPQSYNMLSSRGSDINPLRSLNIPPAPPTHHQPQQQLPTRFVKPQQFNAMTGSTYQTSSSPVLPRSGPADQSTPVAASSSSPHKTNSLRRPKKQPPSAEERRAISGGGGEASANYLSASREELKAGMMTQSTEQLSAEMAHLDCIMQDLNAIKNDFENT